MDTAEVIKGSWWSKLPDMRSVLLICLLLGWAAVTLAQEDRRIEFRITGAGKDTLYLANYYGNRLFYSDTAVADENGTAVFERRGGYKAGLYALLIGTKRIEFVVNEKLIVLASDSEDPNGKLTVVSSKENDLYRERARLMTGPNSEVALRDLARKNPGTFVAQLIEMGTEPITSPQMRADGTTDTAATRTRMCRHYWDNTHLDDPRILYAPPFQNRLDEFLAVVLPHKADSINWYIDDLIARNKGSEELTQYVVSWITTRCEGTKDPQLNVVYVHMALKYACSGTGGGPGAGWVPVDQWRGVCERARVKAAVMVGARTNDLLLADTTGQKWVSMHAMPQQCVVVVFWSPHCGHCKTALPALHDEYVKQLKALDVGVFAVAETSDSTMFRDWKKFVREHDLDWVNAAVPWQVVRNPKQERKRLIPSHTTENSLNYKQTWEVAATPTFYVLDKDRRVIGKPSSINDLIRMATDHRKSGH